MNDFFVNVIAFALTVVFLGLGGLLLLSGRSYMWILLGAGGFLITATIAAEIEGLPNGWSSVEQNQWIILLVALAVGALGLFVGWNYEHLTVDIMGFAAGLYIASWFDEILVTLDGRTDSGLTWWLALLFVAAGIAGIWATRQSPEQALILISVIIGAGTIGNVLNLDPSSSWTAVIFLSLTLTGIVVQYASLLREKPRLGQQLPPVPHPVSDELPY
jgi:MFS family permease